MFEKLRYITSGESHGRAIVCTIDGIPSNLSVSEADIGRDLARRQKGYGRGGRMKIETDSARILSGVRHGKTLGSPITLLIENRDWVNWDKIMNPDKKYAGKAAGLEKGAPVTRPRPGHADLSGALKYGHRDLRNILERSSARETAARVAAGAVARKFLAEFGIQVGSHVTGIGGAGCHMAEDRGQRTDPKELTSIFEAAEKSSLRCADSKAEKKIIEKIDRAVKDGDTLGGTFEVIVTGVPAGLGSYSQWDRKLNAKLAYSLMSIQAIKGVEIGIGFEAAERPGSGVMDEIFYSKKAPRSAPAGGGFYRKTNNAGGIEGGMSTGMPIVVRAAMKPIPTLRSPLSSVDINTKKKFSAAYERSDVCAVPAASVIGEAVTAIAVADALLDKFGGDSMEEIKRNYKGYLKQIERF